MGIKRSGGLIQYASSSFGPQYFENQNIDRNGFIDWIGENLRAVGWNVGSVPARIGISFLSVGNANQIFLGTSKFWFHDKNLPISNIPVGFIIIDIEDSLALTLQNFASSGFGTGTVVGGNSVVFVGGGINNTPCSCNPSGSFCSFDFNPEGVAGLGRLWGGGIKCSAVKFIPPGVLSDDVRELSLTITSQGVGNLVSFAGRTNVNDPSKNVDSEGHTLKDAYGIIFDGTITQGDWMLMANKYQFFLFMYDQFAGGTFVFACHMYPSAGSAFSNVISGAIGQFTRTGGARGGLGSFDSQVYTNNSSLDTPVVTRGVIADFILPGFGTGLNSLQKLSNNIGNTTIIRDDGSGLIFDPMLAIYDGIDYAIQGWIWDSVIFSNGKDIVAPSGVTVDDNFIPNSNATIDGEDAFYITYSPGDGNTSRGSLVSIMGDFGYDRHHLPGLSI